MFDYTISRQEKHNYNLDCGLSSKYCPCQCNKKNLPSFSHKEQRESVWLKTVGTFLVVQWLRIRLPMQGTLVQALVQEDPTCRGATKPMCHNYRACALEPKSHNLRALEPHAPQQEKCA